jgi:Fis family transcriptional regulator, factor for inversion stimulation protein
VQPFQPDRGNIKSPLRVLQQALATLAWRSVAVKDQLEALISQMIEHGVTYEDALIEFKKRFIKTIMENNKNNRSKTAQALGIHRNTLSRKIDEYRLDHRPKRRRKSSK